jgi:hypothetical protein
LPKGVKGGPGETVPACCGGREKERKHEDEKKKIVGWIESLGREFSTAQQQDGTGLYA